MNEKDIQNILKNFEKRQEEQKSKGPFYSGILGEVRINYRWWRENLIQVEPLPASPTTIFYYNDSLEPNEDKE